MRTKTKSANTAPRKKLSAEQRLEAGKKGWLDFEAEIKSRPNFEERMALAEAEIELWEQLARMREQAGLTQSDLAKALGLSQSAISHLEREGHEGYTIATLRKLAEATNHRMRIVFEPKNAASQIVR